MSWSLIPIVVLLASPVRAAEPDPELACEVARLDLQAAERATERCRLASARRAQVAHQLRLALRDQPIAWQGAIRTASTMTDDELLAFNSGSPPACTPSPPAATIERLRADAGRCGGAPMRPTRARCEALKQRIERQAAGDSEGDFSYLRCRSALEDGPPRPLEEIEASLPVDRTPAEQERLEAAQFQYDVDHLGADLGTLRAVASAQLCWSRAQLAGAEAALGRERKTAKIGGVTDLRVVYDLEREILGLRGQVAALQRRRPLPCGHAQVAPIFACLANADGAGCQERPMRLRTALAEKLAALRPLR